MSMTPALRVEAGRLKGQGQPELHETLSLKEGNVALTRELPPLI